MRKKIIMRPVAVYASVCFLFFAVLARIGYLQSASSAKVAAVATQKYVSLGRSRGYIFDRDREPLVNGTHKNVSVILSTPLTLSLLEEAVRGGEAENIGSGFLICRETEKMIAESALSRNIRTVDRYEGERLCQHILGYTDGEGRGVCGIEKAFDRVLDEASGEIGVSYSVDAEGRVLFGGGLTVENKNYDSAAGIVLTVDADIQRIVQNALHDHGVEKGACVVLDVNTGEILALASVPGYDVNDIAASLSDENSPFIDRALNAYPVGSVFKPFIAAAAVENGIAVNDEFECEGYYNVVDEYFHCFNRRVHGKERLNEAVCNSCNCYFIDIGLKTGAEKILDLCRAFGFGKEDRLASGIVCAAGKLPDEKELSSPAAVANLCFGQGELLAAPLQLAAAYACLAAGGIYRQPYITKYLVGPDGKEYAYYAPDRSLRVLDAGVCAVVNESLRLNMLEGTGTNGAPENVTSAGKTATAQTGKYDENGVERLCTWFCGFFPFDAPEYAVCVFHEDGVSGDCSPVFGEIADKITLMR